MTELRSCPFCGARAPVCEGGINGRPMTYGLVEHDKSCIFRVDRSLTKRYVYENAIEAWNRRAES